jgi:carbon starvation protein
VALTALVAACALEPGDYFKINTKPAKYEQFVAATQQNHQWDLAPKEFDELEQGTGEKLAGRTAGAVTLAVGMAKIFSDLPGMKHLMSYWYHFVIMFEALFILTLLETGTRVARFIFEEMVAQFRRKPAEDGHQPNWALNVTMSVLVCFLWGYLLFTGDIDRLWRMMGIANQLLATIALAVGTTYLLKHAPKRIYALCTAIPLVFVVVTVFTAGVESIAAWWRDAAMPEIAAADAFSLRLSGVLAAVMLTLTAVIILDTVRRWYVILSAPAKQAELQPVKS